MLVQIDHAGESFCSIVPDACLHTQSFDDAGGVVAYVDFSCTMLLCESSDSPIINNSRTDSHVGQTGRPLMGGKCSSEE